MPFLFPPDLTTTVLNPLVPIYTAALHTARVSVVRDDDIRPASCVLCDCHHDNEESFRVVFFDSASDAGRQVGVLRRRRLRDRRRVRFGRVPR